MSLLSITHDDTKGGQGAALPARVYRATIELAVLQPASGPKGSGIQLHLQFGNLRTKNGETEFAHNGGMFRIGNRKVFANHWTEHSNPAAAEVGQKYIKKLLISTGIVATPKAGETVSDQYESWEQLAEDVVGHEAVILTKQRTRKDADGEDVVESDISSYLVP